MSAVSSQNEPVDRGSIRLLSRPKAVSASMATTRSCLRSSAKIEPTLAATDVFPTPPLPSTPTLWLPCRTVRIAASNWASWRCAADGPSLTRPNVISRTMRRQPRSGVRRRTGASGGGAGRRPGLRAAVAGAEPGAVSGGWRSGGGGARAAVAAGEQTPAVAAGRVSGQAAAPVVAGRRGARRGDRAARGGGSPVSGALGWAGCRRSRRNSSRSFMGSSGASRSIVACGRSHRTPVSAHAVPSGAPESRANPAAPVAVLPRRAGAVDPGSQQTCTTAG